MTKKLLIVAAVVLGFLLSIEAFSRLHAQTPVRTLTLIYSNNINGEVDPCPT